MIGTLDEFVGQEVHFFCYLESESMLTPVSKLEDLVRADP